jgi:membrane-bound lytic murein transglycosylase MltF
MTLINASQSRVKSIIFSIFYLALLLILWLPNDMGSLTSFERMQANGQLNVLIQTPDISLTSNSKDSVANVMNLSDIHPNGVTLALLEDFAAQQKVRLHLTVLSDTTSEVNYEDYDLVALTTKHQHPAPTKLILTPAYLTIDAYLVYRKGDRSAVAQPGLTASTSELSIAEPTALFKTFKAIEKRKLRSTTVLSYDWAPYKAFMPKLSGKNLGPALALNWGFSAQADQRLYRLAQDFLNHAQQSGQLAQLQDHFLMLPDQEPLISGPAFTEHVVERLQDYLPIFKKAAQRYQLNWQLLAAISYQESRWQPDAISPTGVRGLMMLTQNTAADMGIANRENPTQSIYGAARYLQNIKGRLPDYITEPDRTWMALAAYNIGPTHLLKAIRATEAAGEDSANWLDVRQQLKQANVPEYASKQKFLRGYDQVRAYVTNVRAYYDYLSRPNLLITHQPSLENADHDLTLALNN